MADARKNNRIIKDFFDEETSQEDESFLSPASDTNHSGTDINASSSRHPLASSSRLSLRNSNKKSTQPKPMPKSKQKSIVNVNDQTKSKGKHDDGSQEQVTQKEKSNKAKRRTEQNREDEHFLPRRKTRNTDKNESRRKQKQPKKNFQVVKDIMKYQSSTDRLIPKLPFSKLIREVITNPEISSNDFLRITPMALEAIQEACEVYLTMYFEDAYRCTIHRGRVTLIVKDMELVRVLRGVSDTGYRNS